MQATTPLISVVLPCYNAEQYLAKAIDSVLQQTFTEFELIVIDDGSQDDSLAIINQAAGADKRIQVVSRANKGLVATLNEGIAMARGRYIARMDADDVCYPDRLLKQWQYMESHPEVLLCGTWAKTLTGSGVEDIQIMPPTSNDEIRALMLFQNCFVHPSVMIRRECFADGEHMYRTSRAEDYDLWARLCSVGAVANIPEVMLEYRIHDKQLTQMQAGAIRQDANDISRQYLERQLGVEFTTADREAYEVLVSDGGSGSADSAVLRLAKKLLRANHASGYCEQTVFESLICKKLIASARSGRLNSDATRLIMLLPELGLRRWFTLRKKIRRSRRQGGKHAG